MGEGGRRGKDTIRCHCECEEAEGRRSNPQKNGSVPLEIASSLRFSQ